MTKSLTAAELAGLVPDSIRKAAVKRLGDVTVMIPTMERQLAHGMKNREDMIAEAKAEIASLEAFLSALDALLLEAPQ